MRVSQLEPFIVGWGNSVYWSTSRFYCGFLHWKHLINVIHDSRHVSISFVGAVVQENVFDLVPTTQRHWGWPWVIHWLYKHVCPPTCSFLPKLFFSFRFLNGITFSLTFLIEEASSGGWWGGNTSRLVFSSSSVPARRIFSVSNSTQMRNRLVWML